jgi:hypothetical protein
LINPFKDTNWNPGPAERRDFARSLVIGFPIFATLLALIGRFGHGVWKPGFFWLGAIGCATGIVLWLIPQIARPFYLVWYFAACCIGIVTSNVLVAAFFALVLTPTGLIMRALGRDPMTRRLDREAKSYWTDAEKAVDPARYFRQF